MEEIEKKLAESLTEFLELTEKQIEEVRPVFEDAFEQLGDMLSELVDEGAKNLEAFSKQYEERDRKLREQLEESLDDMQLEKLEKNRDELKEKISDDLFSA